MYVCCMYVVCIYVYMYYFIIIGQSTLAFMYVLAGCRVYVC